MRVFKVLTESVMTTILLASTLFAEEEGRFELLSPVEVRGKQLSAGEYELRWNGTGPYLDLEILRNGNLLVSVPATISPIKNPGLYNSAVLRNNPNGTKTLFRIVLARKNLAIDIGDSPTTSSNNGN
jgi:hypothetical protein